VWDGGRGNAYMETYSLLIANTMWQPMPNFATLSRASDSLAISPYYIDNRTSNNVVLLTSRNSRGLILPSQRVYAFAVPIAFYAARNDLLTLYSKGLLSYVLFNRARNYVESMDVSEANIVDRVRAINNMWERMDTSEVTVQDLLDIAEYLEIIDVEIPVLPALPVIPELPELPTIPDFSAIIDNISIPDDITIWQDLLDEVSRALPFSIWR